MFFIALLILTTISIAGAAAFFSVYGLAATFGGTFWSVVVMGTSLEAGKLIAASYLYRYWQHTSWLLKIYLLGGIAALMLMTSVGIFGYLSAGYQSDVLPLKQKQERVALLEEEKTRILERKRQIDNLMASAPIPQNLNNQKGEIDERALRALREASRTREQLSRQYRVEQAEVTKRIVDLDKEILELRQGLIKTEAKIGPITYIAKAFDLPTDDATKYLIFLIIFAFDPMAVALTLAVNVAIRRREEEIQETKKTSAVIELAAAVEPPKESPPQIIPTEEEPQPPTEQTQKIIPSVVAALEPTEVQPASVGPFEDATVIEDQTIEPPPSIRPSTVMKNSALSTQWNQDHISDNALRELIDVYKELKSKPTLLAQEKLEKEAIENILRKRGMLAYLS